MPIIRSVLLLLLLDLLTKHAFRFYEQNLSLELALIEGYLYVDEVVFNYGNISLQSDGDDVGFISLMFICLFAIVAFAGSAFGIATLDEEDSKLTVVPSVLMIAGIIGNTFERIIYGNVCDWITFTRPESEYLLVLNFADIFICISLLTLPFFVSGLGFGLFIGAVCYISALWPLYGVMFG